ncbi:hypothetical protein OBBRIDRAFT_465052 [Obba rivulosa]|uniref:Uncharacterized protein n=1 Tax=Obba rivulosa TaxID=1052685 RepID=A0A8E2B233_9APHY|nr:hypothetical protein OBBRIDRAFT_465052 [Obba rivulosa]
MASVERQIRPIYEALDTGSNKSALLACNKLLKKYPQINLIKALKALALVRSQKVEESLVLCDEVLAAKPTDDPTLSAMMHVLRGLGRREYSYFASSFLRAVRNFREGRLRLEEDTPVLTTYTTTSGVEIIFDRGPHVKAVFGTALYARIISPVPPCQCRLSQQPLVSDKALHLIRCSRDAMTACSSKPLGSPY